MRGGLIDGGPPALRGGWDAGWRARVLAARAATRPDLLLVVIGSVILTFVWRFQDLLPVAAPALRPPLLLGVAVLVAMLRLSPRLVGRRLRSGVLLLLTALILIVAIGQPFALDPPSVMRFLLTWMLPGTLLATLIAVSVRSADDVDWLLLVTLGAAATYLTVLYARGGANALTDPAVTVFYDRNDLALVLVALLPACLHLARPGSSGARRTLAGVCFLLFVFTIVRGGSRGGLVGLVAVLGYMLLTYRAVPRSVRIRLALATAVLLAAGGSAYWARMRTIVNPSADYNWASGQPGSWGQTYGRRALWTRGLDYIRLRPLVGVGGNGFPVAEWEWSAPARQRQMTGRRPITALNAHNIFMQVAVELGLPGLAVFVALLAYMARTLVRLRRRYGTEPHVAALAHALLASMVGYVVCGFFLSAAYFPLLFLQIGFVVALAAVAAPERAALPQTSTAGRPPLATRGAGIAPREVPAPARW